MSQKTLNLCLERYNFVKFGETTKSSHTVLCINNAYSVNSDKYRLTPAAIASKHGEGYVFTLNYDFDRPLFTIVQKSYTLDGTSGNIVFEGIDPISKGGSKYLRKVTVSPVKLSDGSYLLEVTNDEYLRIGTTGAALGDEELESLNEKIIAVGGIEKSVETVGGKQVLKLDASGSAGAKEIVYFDVDPSDPPSGIYEAIGEALSNNKEPVIKIDGDVYFYTSTGTDKYIFVGGYNTEVVNYKTVTVSDDDSVVMETVDTIEGMVFPLYYHSENEQFTVADKTGHALTKTEIADAYRAGQIFMFSSYPASNTQAHWGYCCDINIESDNTGYAEFLILAAVGGDVYNWEKYYIRLLSNTEFVTLEGPNTSYTEGGSGRFADAATTVSVSDSQDFSASQKLQGRNNIGAASASDVTALQSQVSSLSDVSAYSVKGEATVAQLNAGPSGIQAGWAYQLTDSGTLTDGSLAVVAGDTVAWDGTKWFPLVKSDYYATKTYAQNVAHSIAPEFDPTRDSEHAYPAGYSVMYTDGKVYTFKVPHYGAWSSSDAYEVDIASIIRMLSGGVDEILTPYVNGNQWLDTSDLTSGKYLSYITGLPVDTESFSYTNNYLPVAAGKTYSVKNFTSGGQVCFYDINKKFIGGSLTNDAGSFVAPYNCCYVRCSFKTSNVNNVLLYDPTIPVTAKSYSFGGYKISTAILNYDKKVAVDEYAGVVDKVVNMFDKDNVVDGQYVSVAGSVNNSASYCYNKFTIEGGKYISTFYVHIMVFFGADNSVVGTSINDAYTGTVKQVQVPANAVYATASVVSSGKNRAYVVYGQINEKTNTPPFYKKSRLKDSLMYDIVVAKDGSGDFTTVTEAARYAMDGDVVFVKPGLYEDEEIELFGKTISLIGENPYTTIITNDLNTYERPPLEMASGRLENLQFIQSGTGTPTGETGWGAYAMHCESYILADNSFYVKNCIFEAQGVSAVGMGMRKGCNVVFENCRFKSNGAPGFYVHDSHINDYIGVQNIMLKDCISESTGNAHAIRLVSEKKEGTTVYCSFVNNTFADTSAPSVEKYTEGSGTATGNTNMDLTNFNLTKMCAGNNISELNYNYE